MLSPLYYGSSKNFVNDGSLQTSDNGILNGFEKNEGRESLSSVIGSSNSTFCAQRYPRSFSPVQKSKGKEDIKRNPLAASTSMSTLHEERSNAVEANKHCRMKRFSSCNSKKFCEQVNSALAEVLGVIAGPDSQISSQILLEKREQFLAALFSGERQSSLPPFFSREHITQLLGPEYRPFVDNYYQSLHKLNLRKDLL